LITRFAQSRREKAGAKPAFLFLRAQNDAFADSASRV
jgi:hypothetical protein